MQAGRLLSGGFWCRLGKPAPSFLWTARRLSFLGRKERLGKASV